MTNTTTPPNYSTMIENLCQTPGFAEANTCPGHTGGWLCPEDAWIDGHIDGQDFAAAGGRIVPVRRGVGCWMTGFAAGVAQARANLPTETVWLDSHTVAGVTNADGTRVPLMSEYLPGV